MSFDTPPTQPDGQFVPPGRHPPTAVAMATPEPPPRGIGARLRGAVLRVLDVADQLALFHQIMEESLSVRSVEALVKDKKQGTRSAIRPNGTDWDPEVDRITEQFHQLLRTSVHLKNSMSGKGKIIISYKNRAELERILSQIGEA
jgi:hypothetical protein